MENHKWIFIINPIAGNGYGEEIKSILEKKVAEYNIPAEYVTTERKGHAGELSKKYADLGYKYIIAVGGDGTVNEVFTPIINRKDIISGAIPAGTGNDFIQLLGFPNRFTEENWKTFFDLNTKLMDVGHCNGNYFLNGMGLGFDAQVAAENYAEPGVVKEGGKNKYIWHIVKTLLFFKEIKMKIVGGENAGETDCFINTISIGRRFAGGFYLTPKALADDGLLDVCMIKKLNLLQRLKILMQVPKGTHIHDPKVNYYQTPNLQVSFDKEVPYHLDGELFFATEIDVSLLPKALNFIYNPNGEHFFKD
ncbi:MAG: diacylglycerol kinase family lipid kinase [Bacteroidetes bacterium]|jgi:diacylglycerol kinase (ATP)|nr:diacylglycerol kinase family lipid kinase [Bacteroidota bacterium]MBT4340081.1 diacylglycerol kinase family lipid kinase [Bacteroidota bacterium]MBT4727141.1 diacylglycerol kinase family lipid kinase [Bacteroidota bacterium]MBT5989272.1 diacylglycerol kinase family lipid kinase [Bacteroidota bacterium]MBT6837659.1 diacylglycerol kinase family lipid kinase [Bacteroidota bacterium]